eukprot:755683-Hanusia_phi.AAC.1
MDQEVRSSVPLLQSSFSLLSAFQSPTSTSIQLVSLSIPYISLQHAFPYNSLHNLHLETLV